MSDTVGTGTPDQPEREADCWLCEGTAGADGKVQHREGCPQARVQLDLDQLRRDLEARERDKGPKDPPAQDKKAQPPRPSRANPNIAANMANLMGQLADAVGPQPAQLGADGQPLSVPESPEVKAERQLREREDRLTSAQRAALQEIRERNAKGVPPDDEARRQASLRAIPDWMTEYLREHGVPDEALAEHRYSGRYPDLTRWAPRPEDADVAPILKPQLNDFAQKLWAVVKGAQECFDGIESAVVHMFQGFERSMQLKYIESGAIYGPSQEGLWQWIGEQAELQKALSTVERITRDQEARMAVNSKFPRFWKGEWFTGEAQFDEPPTDTQEGPDDGPAGPAGPAGGPGVSDPHEDAGVADAAADHPGGTDVQAHAGTEPGGADDDGGAGHGASGPERDSGGPRPAPTDFPDFDF